jgi:hypothetical protein
MPRLQMLSYVGACMYQANGCNLTIMCSEATESQVLQLSAMLPDVPNLDFTKVSSERYTHMRCDHLRRRNQAGIRQISMLRDCH